MSIDRLNPAYFECLVPTSSPSPTATPVIPLSSPPTSVRITCSGQHVSFLKDLTYNNKNTFCVFFLFIFHILFHTFYVLSYTHSLFNHSFLFSFYFFFCLFYFCLFCLPPFLGEYCSMPRALMHVQLTY